LIPGDDETVTTTEPFEAFYSRSLDVVFRAVLLTTRHPQRAEDAVHEAFGQAFESWETISRHPNPLAWTIRVALNRHASSWRIWRRELPEPPEIEVADELPIDPFLLRAVWRLPRRQREVVALRVLADLSAEQTAQLLGMTAGAVGSHLHRALGTLRENLAATEYAEAR
jgi:RNA polymerase sigma factor (sigma-70 family)